ncbi:secretory lipase [Nocardia pseudobrasiliensis]|uniref:Secretory lipase n=2 Tax=Nocardia pseudobrasiliensis TaxID=45979 RepID=A0A370IE83_9NOCA|nr:secretory lipase [Nocardia pseudobrasiliensis]
MRRLLHLGRRKPGRPFTAALLTAGAIGFAHVIAAPQICASPASDVAAGTLLQTGPDDHLDPQLASTVGEARRFVYRSTGLAGKPAVVSGVYLTPAGMKPREGWPLIALGHGFAGMLEQCAPSADPSMYGSLPVVQRLIGRGWAVVMTDYQGLGTPGPHPALNTAVAGADILDSIRAVRQLTSDIATTTTLLGISEGGHAAESAAEMAPRYAPELRLRALALASPALDLAAMPDLIDQGRLTLSQEAGMPLVAAAVAASTDPSLPPTEVVHGVLAAGASTLLQCTTVDNPQKAAIAALARPSDVSFSTPRARTDFQTFLSDNALPRSPHTLPTFIARGSEDTLILPEWTTAAVAHMRQLGTNVDDHVGPVDHNDPATADWAIDWVAQQLHNQS